MTTDKTVNNEQLSPKNANHKKLKKPLSPSSATRCVTITSADDVKDYDVQKHTVQPLNRNRKRPRPNNFTKIIPLLSISKGDDSVVTSLDMSSPRGPSCFVDVEKETKCSNGATTKYSPPSPVRSVVSCDADVIQDDDSQVSDQGMHGTEEPMVSSESSASLLDEKSTMQTTTSSTSANQTFTSLDGSTDAAESRPEIVELLVKAFKAESKLLPLKSLLSRMMAHPTYNRKGTFNTPVDYVAYGLKDYTTIVKHPMDLGTIKKRLHANFYLNHEDVAHDMRLVFNNAILYNPPTHPVHDAAKGLLKVFEEAYTSLYMTTKPKVEAAVPKITDASGVASFCMPVALKNTPPPGHTCQACEGRTCAICEVGCLSVEPNLLICTGAACAGQKIRRGVHYYCSEDGSKAWCQRCYSNLPAIIPAEDGELSSVNVTCKKDLLKRRNDEDVVERWITCKDCKQGMHEFCAFSNEFAKDKSSFSCPLCSKSKVPFNDLAPESPSTATSSTYSFVSGKQVPEQVENVTEGTPFDSRSLPHCAISSFIEEKVHKRMLDLNCPPHAEETLSVRVISDCEKSFNVPEVVRRHFRMQSQVDGDSNKTRKEIEEFEEPPSVVHYNSKAIALFQRIDGMDICIFCMYVQEYDNTKDEVSDPNQNKRVYIAYLDSVEHFQPRRLRSSIFHEILISYLATARSRGYEYAHIWSCPPSRGNSFVFWGHPPTQRTPNREHLLAWYHNALSQALNCGVITDVKSLYEFSFQKSDEGENDGIMVAPSLIEGDFWMEEAVRVHASSISRFMKSKKASSKDLGEEPTVAETLSSLSSRCPVVHVATVLLDFIMTHANALPFCRPVNAAALKLRDYHDVIKKPMDLGTIHSRCLLGEYDVLADVVADIELVFSNAMRYNPKGHIVHTMAQTLLDFSKEQLNHLAGYWKDLGLSGKVNLPKDEDTMVFRAYEDMSMRLGVRINLGENTKKSSTTTAEANDDSSSSQDLKKVKTEDKEITCTPLQPKSSTSKPAKVSKGRGRRKSTESKEHVKLDLLSGKPDAIAHHMVDKDIWLLNKRNLSNTANKNKKRKKDVVSLDDKMSHSSHGRQESWLGDEVAAAVKRMRTDFFVCRLQPKQSMTDAEKEKESSFRSYAETFMDTDSESEDTAKAGIADTRSGLLEFSQYRNFQFDTLRRAKYSTAMLLYYLKNPNAPGIIPTCSTCGETIRNVRWRRLNKAFDERRRSSLSPVVRFASVPMDREELCVDCHSSRKKGKDDFIPVRVSLKTDQD